MTPSARPLVEIFTDGACRGNPGLGGWAALLRYEGIEKKINGAQADTTNNRMELTAAIESLRALKRPSAAGDHRMAAEVEKAELANERQHAC